MDEKNTTRKWLLYIGTHQGTRISSERHEPKICDSFEECLTEAQRIKDEYATKNCKIWYAYVIGPNDARMKIFQGTRWN